MSDEKKEQPQIAFIKNGPIKVTNLQTLKNSRGELIETKPKMILCRCGASKHKPFCDGTHKTVGFRDDKADDRKPDALDEHKGKRITILDNRGACSGAGFCSRGLPAVFNRKKWADPDAAPPKEIIETIEKCPSGALSYAIDDQVHAALRQDPPEIRVSRDGPLQVQGDFAIDAELAQGVTEKRCTLCRCGQSKNKPFCDGTHWYAGFKDNEDLTISAANRRASDAKDEWVKVADISEIEVDALEPVQIGTKQIVVARTKDGSYAVDARCPHQGGPLGEGEICEGKIRCPWHGFKFDLKSGRGVGNDDTLPTFEVRQTGSAIEVLAPKPERSSWTVSHLVMETLVEWGLDTVFGLVGHSNLGVAEAIRAQENKGRVKYFGVRHEAAASFACSGYAKIKGTPAACLAIAGPGATNLLTGLWDAKMDRAPAIALAGQVDSQVLGPGAFQEIDTQSAFAAVSKFCQPVLADSKHAELASLAFKNAVVERDVATLIFPDEIQVQDAGDAGPGRPDGRLSDTAITPSERSVWLAGERIAASRRPLIIVGYGARHAMPEVTAFAEQLSCPIVTTFKAKGQISDSHPLGAGVLGKSGTPVASTLMNEADLLIVFGSSFAKHTGIDTHRPIIQVDYDRMALGKFHAVDEAIWGDIGVTARLLAERAGALKPKDQRAELAKLWASWRAEKERRAEENNQKGLSSAAIFERLSRHVPEDAILSVDVGNNTYSFGRYFECKDGQQVIMSGYLGSIGFGFPAAMGAWAAVRGKRKVVAVAGDGGFGQYLAEFTTAVKYGMDITLVLLHNGELGKISKEQRDGEWEVWQTSLRNPSFSEYAKLCGGDGVRVNAAEDLDRAFETGLAAKSPFIVEIMSDALLT